VVVALLFALICGYLDCRPCTSQIQSNPIYSSQATAPARCHWGKCECALLPVPVPHILTLAQLQLTTIINMGAERCAFGI